MSEANPLTVNDVLRMLNQHTLNYDIQSEAFDALDQYVKTTSQRIDFLLAANTDFQLRERAAKTRADIAEHIAAESVKLAGQFAAMWQNEKTKP